MRKLFIYIASSLDGYIAGPNDDLSFLQSVEKEGADYGYAAFTANIDTIILGRKTYDWVEKNVGTAHYDAGGKKIYVITRSPRPDWKNTTFYTGDLIALVQQLKSGTGQHIYCDGGAQIIHELLKHNLIDEFIISVIPVLLGNGVKLFNDGRPELRLDFVGAKTFDTGLVQVHYRKKP